MWMVEWIYVIFYEYVEEIDSLPLVIIIEVKKCQVW